MIKHIRIFSSIFAVLLFCRTSLLAAQQFDLVITNGHISMAPALLGIPETSEFVMAKSQASAI